ncbi:AAA family ATPase [Archangium sp. Cb G35]|uniref:AAA family ATPase n=1 Tax=Archangium sp. Cb G35 TaxID=1920190 RepID=UPI00130176C5|nr:AAA family ATPase [Archangium sp. Cb G35]
MRALDYRGGVANLANFEADRNGYIVLGIELNGVDWSIGFTTSQLRSGIYEERLSGQALQGYRVPHELSLNGTRLPVDERSLLRLAADNPATAPGLHPLLAVLQNYRCYTDYHLAHIRENGSPLSSEKALDVHGRNVFSVLRNWRDTRADRVRFNFVMEGLRTLFPDNFADLDFETAGTTVAARVVAPRPDTTYPITFAANGLLVALLHLCAVASVPEGGMVAIDEVENALHPFAIKRLVEAFRSWSAQTKSTVLLATHSPVVLDQFRDCPEQVYVMEPSQETNPVPLSKFRDPEYLSHFSLGDLYAHLEFGAPREPEPS